MDAAGRKVMLPGYKFLYFEELLPGNKSCIEQTPCNGHGLCVSLHLLKKFDIHSITALSRRAFR